MKTPMRIAVVGIGLSVLLLAHSSIPRACSDELSAPSADATKKLLRHVVIFKFKDSASKDDIAKVAAAFARLPDKIDSIVDFEWGINNSPEKHDKGFTHCFLVSFENEAGRAVYLPHPAHKDFVEVLKPHLDDVMVIDYWTGT